MIGNCSCFVISSKQMKVQWRTLLIPPNSLPLKSKSVTCNTFFSVVISKIRAFLFETVKFAILHLFPLLNNSYTNQTEHMLIVYQLTLIDWCRSVPHAFDSTGSCSNPSHMQFSKWSKFKRKKRKTTKVTRSHYRTGKHSTFSRQLLTQHVRRCWVLTKLLHSTPSARSSNRQITIAISACVP